MVAYNILNVLYMHYRSWQRRTIYGYTSPIATSYVFQFPSMIIHLYYDDVKGVEATSNLTAIFKIRISQKLLQRLIIHDLLVYVVEYHV